MWKPLGLWQYDKKNKRNILFVAVLNIELYRIASSAKDISIKSNIAQNVKVNGITNLLYAAFYDFCYMNMHFTGFMFLHWFNMSWLTTCYKFSFGFWNFCINTITANHRAIWCELQPRSLVFPCFLRFSFSFLSHSVHPSCSISPFFEKAALHQSKNTRFALCEREYMYLYSVLLIEDIKYQNREQLW